MTNNLQSRKRPAELSIEEFHLTNTPGSLKKAKTTRRTENVNLSEKLLHLLTPGFVRAASTESQFNKLGVVQVIGSKVEKGVTFFKLCDSEEATYNVRGANDEINAAPNQVPKFPGC